MLGGIAIIKTGYFGNGFSQKIIRKLDISKFIGEVYYVFYIFVGSTKNALIRVILWVRTRQQLI